MGIEEFKTAVRSEVEKFKSVAVISRLLAGEVTLVDYQMVLSIIFHQVQESSSTFSLAAACLPMSAQRAKAYLMKHAEEEKTHWEWILNDLKATNYQGPDPQVTHPAVSASAYIAYNYYVSLKFPMGRLAIACMLESMGAAYGEAYAIKIGLKLGLRKDQMVFFIGHGDTDVGHSAEIFEVLAQSSLGEADWDQLIYVAQTAGCLYRRMYDMDPVK